VAPAPDCAYLDDPPDFVTAGAALGLRAMTCTPALDARLRDMLLN
jgi:hypothetical protein